MKKFLLTSVTISLFLFSCGSDQSTISKDEKFVSHTEMVPSASASTQFIRETGIMELRLTSNDWLKYVQHYRKTIEVYRGNPYLKQYKQRVLNMIILESNWAQSALVTRESALYIVNEFDRLETAYPKANYLALDRLLELSAKEYSTTEEFVAFAANAYKKGFAAQPKATAIAKSDNSTESYVSNYKENYEVYLPKLKDIYETR